MTSSTACPPCAGSAYPSRSAPTPRPPGEKIGEKRERRAQLLAAARRACTSIWGASRAPGPRRGGHDRLTEGRARRARVCGRRAGLWKARGGAPAGVVGAHAGTGGGARCGVGRSGGARCGVGRSGGWRWLPRDGAERGRRARSVSDKEVVLVPALHCNVPRAARRARDGTRRGGRRARPARRHARLDGIRGGPLVDGRAPVPETRAVRAPHRVGAARTHRQPRPARTCALLRPASTCALLPARTSGRRMLELFEQTRPTG